MAAKSLTLKFGADTSKLTRALGKMRKQITSSVQGALSFATSLRGLAMAGIAGFGASQLTGMMMNLSPEFANAMLKLQEPINRLVAVLADQLAPHILRLADFLEGFLGKTATTVANAGGQQSLAAAPGVGYSVRGIMWPSAFPTESPFGSLFR
jgi:hypothetical protein